MRVEEGCEWVLRLAAIGSKLMSAGNQAAKGARCACKTGALAGDQPDRPLSAMVSVKFRSVTRATGSGVTPPSASHITPPTLSEPLSAVNVPLPPCAMRRFLVPDWLSRRVATSRERSSRVGSRASSMAEKFRSGLRTH